MIKLNASLCPPRTPPLLLYAGWQAPHQEWKQHRLGGGVRLLRGGVPAQRGCAEHGPTLVRGIHDRRQRHLHRSRHQI